MRRQVECIRCPEAWKASILVNIKVTCSTQGLTASQRMRRISVAILDRKEKPMLDLVLLAVGLGFFVLSLAYVYGCERL
jgi:hypothetical protein